MEVFMKKIFSVILTVVLILVYPYTVSAENKAPEVSAKACVLIEEKTGKILFEKNSSEKLPMASTTKIMTTLLCLESGGLDDQFVVDGEAIKVEGSSMGLTEGDVVTKRALCYGMMLPSGNDAANATAVKLGGSIENFADMMNERAEKIGMTRTCFVTPSGLEGEGHGSSAYDMALLAREALRNPDFAEICSQKKAKVEFGNPPYERWLTNSNKLLDMYQGVKGVKTGFTDEAGRCIVSACEREGISLICVTLNDKNDWQDHINMYDYGYSVLQPLELSTDEIFAVPVAGGTEDTIPVRAEEQILIGDDGKTANRISSSIILPPFVYSDIKTGDKIGEIKYYYDGRYIDSISLNAMKNTEYKETEKKTDKNFFEKIFRLLHRNVHQTANGRGGVNGRCDMKERQEDGRFCRAYLRTMDPERAAAEINRRDGYTMLGRKTTQQHLEQMRSAAAATVKREDILRQLAKLAFGGAEDAVRLALERGETAPEGLELSAVSELRVTEKGVEVKLVDRVRALETLWRLLGESGGAQQDELYRALTELGGGTEDWNGE